MHGPGRLGRRAAGFAVGALVGASALAQTTQRVSVSTGWLQGNFASTSPSISADGRFVAFQSSASNLVAGDANASSDVFVRDRLDGTTVRASVDSSGVEGTGNSEWPAISGDGRFVAFASYAPDLVPGDENLAPDIFVRDLSTGATERVSVDSSGMEATAESGRPAISADGRFVAFASLAPNLVQGDANGTWDVFVRDLESRATERVSVDGAGAEGNDESRYPSISADGRYVAFWSSATNLVPGDSNGWEDVFVRDREAGTTERVSIESTGGQANNASGLCRISADGTCVAFSSFASNLVVGDGNFAADVFLRDRPNAVTVRVSLSASGPEGNSHSSVGSISADGRFVGFNSFASNLVAADTNAEADAFLRDRLLSTTERVSLALGGAQSAGWSGWPVLSADGRFAAFESRAANLSAGDTNAVDDVFVRDRSVAGFPSLCEPATEGVQACPCSNPPSGPGRGCDNSSGTGGAALAASGAAELSIDTLVFTTSGEKPTALSLVLQGDVFVLGGTVYGQGIRCVGGATKRLYTKTASGGSITAPDFGEGDLPVSEQSAARGDPIAAGEARWYLVFYRDPIVLGGCPPTRTFNATQTLQATWTP